MREFQSSRSILLIDGVVVVVGVVCVVVGVVVVVVVDDVDGVVVVVAIVVDSDNRGVLGRASRTDLSLRPTCYSSSLISV